MKLLSLELMNLGANQLSKTQNKKESASFADILSKSLDEVNDLQIKTDKQAVEFSLGNTEVDIHDLMISMEKAQLALSLTIEIRNKLVESYQEVMRMQV